MPPRTPATFLGGLGEPGCDKPFVLKAVERGVNRTEFHFSRMRQFFDLGMDRDAISVFSKRQDRRQDSLFKLPKGNWVWHFSYVVYITTESNAVASEIRVMQESPVGQEELDRAKALLLRQMPLGQSSMDEIVQALADRVEFGLPLNETY
jgi:hypothetical protein